MGIDSDHAENENKDNWMRRYLGATRTKRADLELRPRTIKIPAIIAQGRSKGHTKYALNYPERAIRITQPPAPGENEVQVVNGDRTFNVRQNPEGRRVFIAPPPPVRELTFSGGGAKGVALAGAVKALEDTGVLDEVKVVTGASVGSMTAALIAVGMDAKSFTELSNDPAITDEIVEGTGGKIMKMPWAITKNVFKAGTVRPLRGDGLDAVMRRELDKTLRARIEEYKAECERNGVEIDKSLPEIEAFLDKYNSGPTFEHLRTLSKFIPKIKEVVITGTYKKEIASVPPPARPNAKKKEEKEKEKEKEKEDEYEGYEGKKEEKGKEKEYEYEYEYEEDEEDDDEEKAEDKEKEGTGAIGAAGVRQKFENGNDRGQLYVFDAEHEPHMLVATAVRASAAFPFVFKQHPVVLDSGLEVNFIDGGVMNNTPTRSSIGNERNLDPMPDSRGMTFMFEGKRQRKLSELIRFKKKRPSVADNIATGKLDDPGTGWLPMSKWKDSAIGSDNTAAEFAKNRDASEHPEEIVVVPLKVRYKAFTRSGAEEITLDMRSGTLEFDTKHHAKLALQYATWDESIRHVEREAAPRETNFESDSHMFTCIRIEDLRALAERDYDGASEALGFREGVARLIDLIVRRVREGKREKNRARDPSGKVLPFSYAPLLKDKQISYALEKLDKLAGNETYFQSYVAREMNRGPLDDLLAAARKAGIESSVLNASFAVAEALKTRSIAQTVLTTFIYPRMVVERRGGEAIKTLVDVEKKLRKASSFDDLNEQLMRVIELLERHPNRKVGGQTNRELAELLRAYLIKKK